MNKAFFKNRIFSDVILNICSVFICTAVLQFIALPMLSKEMNSDDYGILLAMVSMFQLVSGTLANTLNNIHLLNQDNRVEAFCNFLVILFVPTIAIITIVYCVSSGTQDILTIIVAVATSCLLFGNDYFSVYYRLSLNYKMVLLSSVVASIMYFVGAYLGCRTQVWMMPYFLSYAFSLLIALIYGKPWKNGIEHSKKNIPIVREMLVLMGAKFMNRIITYADKIVLLGLLGGSNVSVYYVAGLLGKCLSMVVTPLNNVVLSHLCSKGNGKTRMFDYTFLCGGIACLLFYGITFLIEKPFLVLLYPDFAEAAMNYIAVTNAAALIMTLVSMLEPFVLKNCSINFQLLINGMAAVAYLILTVVLGSIFGLMGFCVACLIAYVFKLFVVVCVYKRWEYKEKRDK